MSVRFVLDASVAITWAMRDEAHPTADLALHRIQTGSAVVPGIFWYEVRNILLVNERRSRILPADTALFLRNLDDLTIDTDFPQNGAQIMALARKHKLTVYDAAYLAIAILEHLPIATLDTTLEAAAVAEGILPLS